MMPDSLPPGLNKEQFLQQVLDQVRLGSNFSFVKRGYVNYHAETTEHILHVAYIRDGWEDYASKSYLVRFLNAAFLFKEESGAFTFFKDDISIWLLSLRR